VFRQRFVGRVQLGPTDILSQPILLQSSLYYEPHTLEAEYQHRFGLGKATLGIAYQRWQSYRPSFLAVQTADSEGNPSVSQNPAVTFHDTWNPRLSLEVPVGKWATIATGYQYRPGAVGDLSGAANILDADTHVFGWGVSHRFGVSPAFPWAVTL